MANIKEITLYNFKASYGETKIELDGKNLLMYGENGSGKSSVYWALYTLLQSSTKTVDEIKKYFEPKNEQNLINTHFIESQSYFDEKNEKIIPDSIGLNSNIKIILENGTEFTLDSRGLTTDKKEVLEFLNKRSDFISHRLLINFYNYRNSKKINLWEVFVRDIFPFINTKEGDGEYTLSDELKDIENNPPFSINGDFFKVSKSTSWQNEYEIRVTNFNNDVDYWIGEINTKVNDFFKSHFKEESEKEFRISLIYEEKLEFKKWHPQYYKDYERWYNYAGFNLPQISLKIEIKNDNNNFTPIPKPQSYFNEAKLTSIALAVRFSLLLEYIRPNDGDKFLALDDLLVSLDMSNRDKVLDIILNEFAPKYKIYLFTHEMEFFNYCKFKISQKGQTTKWKLKEMYFDDDDKKPIIIDSELDYLDKAEKYFRAKDYVASAVYLRKDIEQFIKIRIPDVFKKNTENEYHNLEHYWNLFIERYQALGINLDTKYHHWFKQTKLVVLNPSAHANISLQIYKVELEKAFEFRRVIEKYCPINDQVLVIAEKTKFEFRHPTEKYFFEFYFKTDFLCAKQNQNFIEILPKAIIESFSYNGILWWDFQNKSVYNISFIEEKILNKEVKFDKMLDNLKKETFLAITDEMFFENTFVKNSTLSLNEILQKFIL